MSAWTRWLFVGSVLAVLAVAFWFGFGPGKSSVAVWEVQGAYRPADTELSLLVNENACASGTSAEGRIQKPDVEYRSDSVVVTIRVRQRGSSESCPGNPDTPYVLRLEEPVGNRQLLDGGQSPPGPPQLRPEG